MSTTKQECKPTLWIITKCCAFSKFLPLAVLMDRFNSLDIFPSKTLLRPVFASPVRAHRFQLVSFLKYSQ